MYTSANRVSEGQAGRLLFSEFCEFYKVAGDFFLKSSDNILFCSLL